MSLGATLSSSCSEIKHIAWLGIFQFLAKNCLTNKSKKAAMFFSDSYNLFLLVEKNLNRYQQFNWQTLLLIGSRIRQKYNQPKIYSRSKNLVYKLNIFKYVKELISFYKEIFSDIQLFVQHATYCMIHTTHGMSHILDFR